MFEYRVDRFGRKWVSCNLFNFGRDAGMGAIARINLDKMDEWIHHDELHDHLETTYHWDVLKGADYIDLSKITQHFRYADAEDEEAIAKNILFIHIDNHHSYGLQETMWVCICDETYQYTDERIGVIWSLTDEPCFDMDKADQLDYEWQMNAYNEADFHWLLGQMSCHYDNWDRWLNQLDEDIYPIHFPNMLTDVIQEVANSGTDYLDFCHDHYELDEDKFFEDCRKVLLAELRKFFANPEYGPHKRKLQRERWLKLC